MRFDPKLIQPDDAPLDPHGELDLPDDLLELAAQLGDDAGFLSARYPAPLPLTAELAEKDKVATTPATPSVTHESTAPWMRRSTWLTLGATSALLILGAIGWYRPQQATPVAMPPAHAIMNNEVSATEPTPLPSLPIEGARSAPRTVPATMLLNGVSGPELEGLLDLWQSDGESETRISI